jgi:uncharacterized membrane protein YgaE (UPF0421/DUF939 family)
LNLTSAHIRQALQTATAGVLAMYLSRFLGLPEGYWAAITAMIVLQASLGAAIKESWVRIAATAIGAAVAMPFIAFFGQSLVVFGVAVFVTVIMCSALRLQAGLRVAATTVAIIMLIPRPARPWAPGIHRFLEVSFGIIVALVVAKVMWPSSALENLRTGLAEAYLQLNSLFAALMARYRDQAFQDIEQLRLKLNTTMRHNEDLEEQAMYERPLPPQKPKILAALTTHAERIVRSIDALDIATEGSAKSELSLKLDPELGEVSAGIEQCLNGISEAILANQLPESAGIDLPRAMQSLDTKIAKLREAAAFQDVPLQELIRMDAVCLALRSIATALAETQVTARTTAL